MKQLRIGFLSTAKIGKKNWKAIAASKNCVVSAIASRNLAKSRKFISECQRETPFKQLPQAFGSYQELLESKNVDAIYLPLPTALRKDLVIRAAQNGKHVICEKPCAASVAELKEMVAACKKHRMQFMDGVMFMHNRRLEKIRTALDKNSIGKIKRINSHFSFCGSKDFHCSDIRVDSRLEPQGCLGDLGWYCIRFALWTMNWQMPRRIEGKIISSATNDAKVPTEFSGELFFDGDVSMGFYCSFLTACHNSVDISGTDGYLRVPDFVLPVENNFELNDRVIEPNKNWEAQQINMFNNFANQIFSGKLNSDWPMWSLKTQQVVDACFESAKSKI